MVLDSIPGAGSVGTYSPYRHILMLINFGPPIKTIISLKWAIKSCQFIFYHIYYSKLYAIMLRMWPTKSEIRNQQKSYITHSFRTFIRASAGLHNRRPWLALGETIHITPLYPPLHTNTHCKTVAIKRIFRRPHRIIGHSTRTPVLMIKKASRLWDLSVVASTVCRFLFKLRKW